MTKPRVSFDSANIYKRRGSCITVARAYGWPAAKITGFSNAIEMAFTYEEAMAIINEEFEVQIPDDQHRCYDR